MMDQNGYVDYGDAYMEQEEEWEREGLLDPAWEKQQKKVTFWKLIKWYFKISTEKKRFCDSFDRSILKKSRHMKVFYFRRWYNIEYMYIYLQIWPQEKYKQEKFEINRNPPVFFLFIGFRISAIYKKIRLLLMLRHLFSTQQQNRFSLNFHFCIFNVMLLWNKNI